MTTHQPKSRKGLWLSSPVIKFGPFDCSSPRCEGSPLRETPAGVYCKCHFMALVECSIDGCTDLGVKDKKWNPKGYCRDHMMGPECCDESIPRGYSSISLAAEMI